METTNIQSPATTAAAMATAPAASLTPLPPTANTPAVATPIFPLLSPGRQSSEFYLALLVVSAIVAALWVGKLDPALASALLGLIVSGYPTLRTWLKARHVDAVADVLAAHSKNRGGAVALGALARVVAGSEDAGMPEPALRGAVGDAPGVPGQATVPTGSVSSSLGGAALCVLCLFVACLLTSCAQTPYYVSGINGTVDTSKDGSQITGGEVGVTISPNPDYRLPAGEGLRK